MDSNPITPSAKKSTTMEQQADRRSDSEILFTRSIKAGKRIYYIDVKEDRRGEFYISLTESKRLKDVAEDAPPVFEKHKIFIYREDAERFIECLKQVADYAQRRYEEKNPHSAYDDYYTPPFQFPDEE